MRGEGDFIRGLVDAAIGRTGLERIRRRKVEHLFHNHQGVHRGIAGEIKEGDAALVAVQLVVGIRAKAVGNRREGAPTVCVKGAAILRRARVHDLFRIGEIFIPIHGRFIGDARFVGNI